MNKLTELEKETKFKAFKLVQAIFEEIAKVSDFKGFENDGGEHFKKLQRR